MNRDFITLYGKDIGPTLETLKSCEFVLRAKSNQLPCIVPNLVAQFFPIVNEMPQMMRGLCTKVRVAHSSHSGRSKSSMGGENLEPFLQSICRMAEERAILLTQDLEFLKRRSDFRQTTETELRRVSELRLNLEYVAFDPNVDANTAIAALIGGVETGATVILKELSKPLFDYYQKRLKWVASHTDRFKSMCPTGHLIELYKYTGLSTGDYEFVVTETLSTLRRMRSALDETADLTLHTRVLRSNCHRRFPLSTVSTGFLSAM